MPHNALNLMSEIAPLDGGRAMSRSGFKHFILALVALTSGRRSQPRMKAA
jgi:hypothetical protein